MNLQWHSSSDTGVAFIPLTTQRQENRVCSITSVMFKGDVILQNVKFCDGCSNSLW